MNFEILLDECLRLLQTLNVNIFVLRAINRKFERSNKIAAVMNENQKHVTFINPLWIQQIPHRLHKQNHWLIWLKSSGGWPSRNPNVFTQTESFKHCTKPIHSKVKQAMPNQCSDSEHSYHSHVSWEDGSNPVVHWLQFYCILSLN